jgi:hypothetical protein
MWPPGDLTAVVIGDGVEEFGECQPVHRVPPTRRRPGDDPVEDEDGEQEGHESGGEAGEDHHLLPDGGGDVDPEDEDDEGQRTGYGRRPEEPGP